MSVETLHLMRNDQTGLRELDDVVTLKAVVTVDGTTIAAGTEGTVVGTWTHGEACVVEFPEPEGALATIPASDLTRAAQAPV
ncbi:MAG TPA: DUF4926 domain-containing protein [Methylobacterium sp.]|jgi:hypothetical protein